jgi:hypothetical protein
MAKQILDQAQIQGTTLGYAQITSSFTTTSSTAVQVTGLTTTVTIPSGGRRVRVSVWSAQLSGTAAGNVSIVIYDGTVPSGTQLSLMQHSLPTSATAIGGYASAIITPAAGAKTYNAGIYTSAGTMTLTAATTWPAYILVELI